MGSENHFPEQKIKAYIEEKKNKDILSSKYSSVDDLCFNMYQYNTEHGTFRH